MRALMFSRPKTRQNRKGVINEMFKESGVTCQDGFGHEVLHDGVGPAPLHDVSRHVLCHQWYGAVTMLAMTDLVIKYFMTEFGHDVRHDGVGDGKRIGSEGWV